MTWKEMLIQGVFKNPFVIMSVVTWAVFIVAGLLIWIKPEKIFKIKFNWDRGKRITHKGCPLSKDIVLMFKDMKSAYIEREELANKIVYIQTKETMEMQLNRATQDIEIIADILEKNFLKILRIKQGNKKDLLTNSNFKRWQAILETFRYRAIEEAKFAILENHFLEKDEKDLREYIRDKQEYLIGLMSGVLDKYYPYGFPSREFVYDKNQEVMDKIRRKIEEIIYDMVDIANRQKEVIAGIRARMEEIDDELNRKIEEIFG